MLASVLLLNLCRCLIVEIKVCLCKHYKRRARKGVRSKPREDNIMTYTTTALGRFGAWINRRSLFGAGATALAALSLGTKAQAKTMKAGEIVKTIILEWRKL
ncbi:MAG: hypothetical protein JNK21_00285, partial [Rhodospirillaceae bacterium]|nr:hypothetical protein [Rhodospirillaceae bacterium]